MFGRRKEEDYEEYNERYAAKYDDDYIAPKRNTAGSANTATSSPTAI